MKLRYEFIVNNYIVASLVLYGDNSEETDRVLMTMLREALAIAKVRSGGDVVVLNHGYWQRRFAGNPAIIGQTLNLDGRPTTVVGVLRLQNTDVV